MSNDQPQYDPIFNIQGDGSFADYANQGTQNGGLPPPPADMQHAGKIMIAVDVAEFTRTRDALTSAYMHLSDSIDKAVKAYVQHTNAVIHLDAPLDVGQLTQPFDQLAHTAQMAQAALGQHVQGQANGSAVKEEQVDAKGKKKKKRAYKKRDPNAPKRPLTAYFRFLAEQRAGLSKELAHKAGGNPQKPGDLSKEATSRWHALGKPEQQPYRDAYQRALKDYEKECVKYRAAGGELTTADEKALKANPEVDETLIEKEDDDEDEDAEGEDEEVESPEKAVKAGAEEEDSDDSSSDDSDDSSDEDEEEEMAAPPPPPPQPKATPKSALKKGKQNAVAAAASAPTPQYSSINPNGAAALPQPTPSAKSSSPDRKRKAPATAPETPAVEEPAKKKRGSRKSEKVTAGADPAPAVQAPVAQMQVSSDATGSEPAKKEKRKKRKSEA